MDSHRGLTNEQIESDRRLFLNREIIIPKTIMISRSRAFKKKLTKVEEEEPEQNKDLPMMTKESDDKDDKLLINSFKSSKSSSMYGSSVIKEQDHEASSSMIDSSHLESQQNLKDKVVIELQHIDPVVIIERDKPSESESLSAFQKYVENSNKMMINKTPKQKTLFQRSSHCFKLVHKSVIYSIVTSLILLVDLFHEDILRLFLPKSYDLSFSILSAAVNSFFALEMILCFIFVKSYRLSAFHLIDFLTLVALMPTIEIFYISDHSTHPEFSEYDPTANILSGFLLNSHISKTSKASVKGSKLSRFISFIRVLRVFSIGRIYKYNLEKFIQKNEERLLNKKQKEIIKLLRRKPIIISDLHSRKKFFKRVHNVLNNSPTKPNKYNMRDSQINPAIIKNFYQYAMENEKKFRLSNEMENIPFESDILTLPENKKKSYDDTFVKHSFRRPDEIDLKRTTSDSKKRRNTLLPKTLRAFPDENRAIDDLSLDKRYLCECEKVDIPTIPTKFNNKRFSLISRDILAKINKGKLEINNFKPRKSSLTHLLPESFQRAIIHTPRKNMLDNNRRQSSFVSDDISNYCEKCGGYMHCNEHGGLAESIQTFLDSRRDSSTSSQQLTGNKATPNGGPEQTPSSPANRYSSSYTSFQLEKNSIMHSPLKNSNAKEEEIKDSKDSNSALNFLKHVDTEQRRSTLFNQSAFNFLHKVKKKEETGNKSPKRKVLKRKKSIVDYRLRFFSEVEDQGANEKTNPRLSLKLSKITTVRIVVLILFLLFIVPFLESENYFDNSFAYAYTVDLLSNYLEAGKIDLFKKVVNNTILNDTFRQQNDYNVAEFGFIDVAAMERYGLLEYYHGHYILYEDPNFHENRSDDNIRVENDVLFLIFSLKDSNYIQAILNINKIIFITIMLVVWTFLITNDVNELVVIPLENVFNLIKDKQIQSENLYYDLNEIAIDDLRLLYKKYQEVFIIDDFFRAMGFNIIKVLGMRSYNFFKPRIFAEATPKGGAFYRMRGILMVIYINDYNTLCEIYGEMFNILLSSIINIIDLTSFEHFGEILKIDGNKILVFWDEDSFDTTEEDPNRDLSSSCESKHLT
jgi:hypothetical protein